MKQLPTEFRKNGYQYGQIWRDEDYAIYSQQDGGFLAYEVFKINKNEAGERFGIFVEASESVPPSTQWGKNAWTCASVFECNEKINQMREDAASRLKSNPDVPLR